MRRLKLILLSSSALLLLPLLIGCHGGIEAFEFIDRRDGSATSLELRDPQRLPEEEEALITGEPRSIELAEPLSVGTEGGEGFYIRYRGGSGSLIRLSYESEEATETLLPFPELSGYTGEVRYYGEIADGSLEAITIEPGEGSLELVELGISPFREGIELGIDGIQVSQGYELLKVGSTAYFKPPEGSGEAVWELVLEQPPHFSPDAEHSWGEVALVPSLPEVESGSSLTVSDAESGGLSGEGVRRVRLIPGEQRVHLHAALKAETPEAVAVAPGRDSVVRAFRVLRVGNGEAIPADMGDILDYPRSRWREERYELFRWSAYPEILIIDTRDYEFQSRLFKRLAFFVEKEGFRGRLLSDSDLRGRHGWNAHNYRPEGLAPFYNAAEEQGFPLSSEELLLREILLREGLLIASEDGAPYSPGVGGILSISQESYPILRELLVTHEAMHGIFYEEAGFRERVRELWEEELSEDEREFWRFFLGYMSYDPADDYLMRNEMQAYLLQYSLETIPGYFRYRIAERLRRGVPHREAYINNFFASYGDSFRASAELLNDYLYRETGFRGGEVILLD